MEALDDNALEGAKVQNVTGVLRPVPLGAQNRRAHMGKALELAPRTKENKLRWMYLQPAEQRRVLEAVAPENWLTGATDLFIKLVLGAITLLATLAINDAIQKHVKRVRVSPWIWVLISLASLLLLATLITLYYRARRHRRANLLRRAGVAVLDNDLPMLSQHEMNNTLRDLRRRVA